MLRRLPSRRTLVTGVILADFILLVIFLVTSRRNATPPPFIAGHPYFLYELDTSEPRQPGLKCVLPRVHPFHPSIWGYLSPPKDIVCKSRQGELTYLKPGGALRFNNSEIERSGYRPGKTLHCHWSPVLRGGLYQDDDDKVVFGEKFPFDANGTQLPPEVEIIRVLCRNFAGFSVYEKLHARIRNNAAGGSPRKFLKNPVNVLIFGLDSMSRLAFIRMLPHTYKYLTEVQHMTVLRGMNKVGDNTYPNLIALLTGDKAYGGGLPHDGTGSFDGWPLLWNNYSEAGYGTLWAEDFPQYGLFNYLAKGFRRPPTDHYLRPLWLALEGSSILKFSSHMCYGSQPKYLLQMEYVRQFVSTYKQKQTPFFGFSFLAELSHEYLSPISAADDHFESFFRFLNDEGHLENTVLIVMSDHGHRFDAIRATEVGHIEERMPFFAIHIPKSISSHQPSVIKTLSLNAGRLVTPFDTHATLVDLLHFAKTGRSLEDTSQSPPATLGQSLFREVPLDRDCKTASIPAHYCTCEVESPLPDWDVRAASAAEATIRRINDLLREGGPFVEAACALLSLKVVRTAHVVQTNEEEVPSSEVKVRVVVEADPSGGVFEATALVSDRTASVLEDVSRINPYGDQSSCIQHVILRKYCYCTKTSARLTDDKIAVT